MENSTEIFVQTHQLSNVDTSAYAVDVFRYSFILEKGLYRQILIKIENQFRVTFHIRGHLGSNFIFDSFRVEFPIRDRWGQISYFRSLRVRFNIRGHLVSNFIFEYISRSNFLIRGHLGLNFILSLFRVKFHILALF